MQSRTLIAPILCLISGAACQLAQGEPPSAASQAALPVSVALIKPEVISEAPGKNRDDAAAALDAALTEAFTAGPSSNNYVLVDRQFLDKVLEERTADAAGLSKIDPKDGGEPLRRLWSAGVLICSQIDLQANSIVIEAVSAQTGQLEASLYVPVSALSVKALRLKLPAELRDFIDQLQESLSRARGKPLFEVTGKAEGALERTQWLLDAATDAACSRVARFPSVSLLQPRQPLTTKEERLLRIMGLTKPFPNQSGEISAAPDFQLQIDLAEEMRDSVPYKQTSINLTFSLYHAGDKLAVRTFKDEVGKWDPLLAEAIAWLDSEMKTVTHDKSPSVSAPDSEALARKLAAEEVSSIAAWTNISLFEQQRLPRAIRQRILDHAMRAAHLDPTNETAAYLVVIHVDARFAGQGTNDRSLPCYDSVITEATRYLDRFGQKVIAHNREVMDYLGLDATCAHAMLEPSNRAATKNVVIRPDPVRFHYAQIYVRNWALAGYLGATDKRYDNSNALSSFGYNLVNYLIPECPDDQLAAEYQYWRDFWDKKISKINLERVPARNQPIPWALVEAAFAVKRKDPAAVRAALETLSTLSPKNQTAIWGGDRYKAYIVPVYLKAAGDPAWQSWQPSFTAKPVDPITLDEMTGFIDSLAPQFPYPAVSEKAPAMLLKTAGSIASLGSTTRSDIPPQQALFAVGNEIWFALPGPDPGNPRQPAALFRAELPGTLTAAAPLDLKPLPWPAAADGTPVAKAIITCNCIQQIDKHDIVWIGTTTGLVRFDRAAGGSWTSRRYTTRQGLPSDEILSVHPSVLKGRPILLVIANGGAHQFSDNGRTYNGSLTHIFTLDPANDAVISLFLPDTATWPIDPSPVVKLHDGRSALLNYLATPAYPGTSLDDIASFNRKGRGGGIALLTDATHKSAQLWQADAWDGYSGSLHEISSKSAEPLLPGAFHLQHISVFPFEQPCRMFGNIYFRNDTPDSGRVVSTTPVFAAKFLVSVNDILWAAYANEIIGYRPDPAAKTAGSSGTWFGPFLTPDADVINMTVAPNAQLLLTTESHAYLLSSDQLLAAAEEFHLVQTGDMPKSIIDKRMAQAGWQAQVPLLILRKEFATATALLDQRQAVLGATRADTAERTRLAAWRARLQAAAPATLPQAIDTYRAIAEDPQSGRCAKVFARVNEIFLLHKIGKYQEMLAVAELATAQFPQLKSFEAYDQLHWYLKDARDHLVAQTRPSSITHGAH